MAFGKHVARAAVASIVGVILASQSCAAQMTGNTVFYWVVTIHVYNAHAPVYACHTARLFGNNVSKLAGTPVA